MHIDLIVSVPHTGTNTVLKQAEGAVITLDTLFKSRSLQRRSLGKSWEAGLIEGNNVVWGHFTQNHIQFIQALSLSADVFVPLRDPLASVLSCVNRGQAVGPHIEAWEIFAERFYPLKLVKTNYVPVDLMGIAAENSKGEYPLKVAYKEEDLDALFPYISRLQPLEYLLRPILEQFGYNQLMWWS